jgi:hypothetical protein
MKIWLLSSRRRVISSMYTWHNYCDASLDTDS